MKTKILSFSAIILGINLTFCPVLFSEDVVDSRLNAESKKHKLTYQAPNRSAPLVRIDGIRRGFGSALPSLYVLAPKQVGYTLKEKPTLYWYQSEPSAAQFEFVLLGEDKTKPIFTFQNTPSNVSGIQSVRLVEHNVKLSKGIQYTWYVTIVPDPEHRTKDIFASGMIERITPSPRVAKGLVNKSKKDLVYVLAEGGIWYDALETISSLIESDPREVSLRELRAELLYQGNLPEIADYDRAF